MKKEPYVNGVLNADIHDGLNHYVKLGQHESHVHVAVSPEGHLSNPVKRLEAKIRRLILYIVARYPREGVGPAHVWSMVYKALDEYDLMLLYQVDVARFASDKPGQVVSEMNELTDDGPLTYTDGVLKFAPGTVGQIVSEVGHG